jgi:hypothetical protein
LRNCHRHHWRVTFLVRCPDRNASAEQTFDNLAWPCDCRIPERRYLFDQSGGEIERACFDKCFIIRTCREQLPLPVEFLEVWIGIVPFARAVETDRKEPDSIGSLVMPRRASIFASVKRVDDDLGRVSG